MKIKRNSSRFSISLRIKQFPWKFSKLIRLKKRKWLKVKFAPKFSNLKKIGKTTNFRFFRTYKKRIKKLFRIYFAPKLTDRQTTKLLRMHSRYRATFNKILQSEKRLDVLVFRFYMLSDVGFARELIKKNFFLLNNKEISYTAQVVNIGDFLSVSNVFSWQFLYNNMLTTVSSLIKYFNRLFFKFSFPFIIKRRNFFFKEHGKFKSRLFKLFEPTVLKRLTTRDLFLRYKKVKSTTNSKVKPAKKYYFKNPKKNEKFKEKRLKQYVLKKVLSLTLLNKHSKENATFFQKKLIRQRKISRQLYFIKKFSILAKKIRSKSYSSLNGFKNVKRKKNKKKIKKAKNQLTPLAKRLFLKRTIKFKKKRLEKRKRILWKTLKTISLKVKKSKINKSSKVLLSNKLTLTLKKIRLKFKGLFPEHFRVKPLTVKKVASNSKLDIPRHLPKLYKTAYSLRFAKKTKGKQRFFFKKRKNLPFYFQALFLGRKNKHYQFSFDNHSKKQFVIQNKRAVTPRWRKWVPKHSQNSWQVNRLTKTKLYLFRYLKKFNNKYKQYHFYQQLKQTSWKKIKNVWQKTLFLFEKKKKKLLAQTLTTIIYIKKKVKTFNVYNKKLLDSSLNHVVGEKYILRTKRKYLRIKGFFRQYKNLKINVNLNTTSILYKPIQIQYKKIKLLFKTRPISFFFAEANYKTLEFTLVTDVDFLFFPYKTLFDFKTLSLMA